MDSFSIQGRPTHGLGWATETVALQMPHLLPHLPELAGCHHATINLRLNGNLRIENADVVTPPLDWSGAWTRVVPPERFWLTQMEFELSSQPDRRQTGWIYDAEYSPHRKNPWFVEFLAPFTPYAKEDLFTLYFRKQARKDVLFYLS